MDQQALVEYRYRAVREVLGGAPIGEVAARYGTSRQSVHAWRKRFEAEGMVGLIDRSRRPKSSPTRLPAEIEAMVCELRRQHPRWGARRIAHELAMAGVEGAPSRATVHRVLVRNGLVTAQAQDHKRVYRRWQREAPMQLWQLDLVGGVPLADGREVKMVTGIDDNSRFVVVSTVVAVPSGRAVCTAFSAAMRRYGVPFEVLTDNGKQFTGRHTRPQPVEVLFERNCRENGITQRLTKPRSPTTTGKIERFHKTLRRELLDHVAPFESIAAAQAAIDEWVHTYNHQRPHQSLDMATPASRFRAHGPSRDDDLPPGPDEPVTTSADGLEVREPPAGPRSEGAVEFELRVPPGGDISLVPGKQKITVKQGLAGRTLTVWADLRSIHLTLDGYLVRTIGSRLLPDDLAWLSMRGARQAGPAPAAPALPRVKGRAVLAGGDAIEVDRKVHNDGSTEIAGHHVVVGFAHAGRKVTLRLDGHLMHAIIDNTLVGTWPCPIALERASQLTGARPASTPLPPPPLPAGSIRAQRRVANDGRIMIANQRIKLGRRHAGKLVTVVIEDTHFRILHGDEELAIKPRRSPQPITRLYIRGKGTADTSSTIS